MRMKIDIKREKEKQKAWEIMINHMVRHLFNIFYCKKIKPKIFLKTIIEKILQKREKIPKTYTLYLLDSYLIINKNTNKCFDIFTWNDLSSNFFFSIKDGIFVRIIFRRKNCEIQTSSWKSCTINLKMWKRHLNFENPRKKTLNTFFLKK